NLSGSEYVEIGRVHEDVENSAYCHARDKRERNIALRILKLAGHKRHLVPTIVSPQCTKHRGSKPGAASAGHGCNSFALTTLIGQSEMRPITAREKQRTQTQRHNNAD